MNHELNSSQSEMFAMTRRSYKPTHILYIYIYIYDILYY